MKLSKIFLACGTVASLMVQSCSLDEYNPAGEQLEDYATTPQGWEYLLNNIYFALERKYYNDFDFMKYTEANSDLWTVKVNNIGQDNQYFKFYANTIPNTTYTDGLWTATYDGIGSCNVAIRNVNPAFFKNEEEMNAKLAQAYFIRAIYYYNLVELFGGVVVLDTNDDGTNVSFSPTRTAPIDVYRDVILPDLRFAAKWLPVGDETYDVYPTKKGALGYLAKACLATQQYGTTEFLQEGFQAAKDLISDCESGGSKYGAFMYANYEDVFKEANNKNNKEALWKYTIYAGSDGHGSSNGNFKTNRNDEHFLCQLNHFGARIANNDAILTWEADVQGDFMPTQHLLKLFVQEDGSLDPRFHNSFITEWKANQEYSWNDGDISNYDKAASLKDSKIKVDDPAIRFVMPQDATYAAEVAGKANSNYVLIDYKDVYDDAKKSIIMTKGTGENHYRYFYPSLSKHASSNYFTVNAGKMRNGNLNAVIPMRMAEIYLIAAEYDILLNGGSGAMAYINKIRNRAGAKALTGSATIRTVLDERARELCGEFTRFYDLKRTGMFKNANYLQETHPDLAQYFKPEYALHPIPQGYVDLIGNGADFVNPGF